MEEEMDEMFFNNPKKKSHIHEGGKEFLEKNFSQV